MTTGILVAPLALQALVMAVDEGHYHRRRGLPRWERLGHPLDTLTVLVTYAWALLADPARPHAVAVYVGLAFFSCLFVTKDEFVHARLCQPGEGLVHALLFVLHPIVFLCFALLWIAGGHTGVMWLQVVLTLLFGLYQLVYWSVVWKR